MSTYKGFLSRPVCLLAIAFWALVGCEPINVYEHHVPIKNQTWNRNQVCVGSFQVSDTLKLHQLYVVIRHTDAYAFSNIWLEVSLKAPGDRFKTQRVNVPLGNDYQGWLGTGMDDIWEVRSLLTGSPKPFNRSGTYEFRIRQIMRDDPLKHVMSAGLRIQ
jgi:gliding motility-associated lipoprotein GldH